MGMATQFLDAELLCSPSLSDSILDGMCALLNINRLNSRRRRLHNDDGEVGDAAALPVVVTVSIAHFAHDASDGIGSV